jgi:hypothetical protein
MSTESDQARITAIANQIWVDEGRPEGKHADHWKEAERRFRADTGEGLKADRPSGGNEQDAPGRPKTASNREQAHPNQQTQTGSSRLDAAAAQGKPLPRGR